MSQDQMIAPCRVECSHCIHYLANTDSAARKQGGAMVYNSRCFHRNHHVQGVAGPSRADTASKVISWRQSSLLDT